VHSSRIVYFDGWRGLSILLVLIGHFIGETRLGLSSLGVELFFALSGRLMADILFAERYPLPAFFQRRFSRVYPALLVFVLLSWIAMSGSSLAFKTQAVAAALTFTLNYAIVLNHGVAVIENLWSLCIEEHAYAILGLVALAARRWRFGPLELIAAAALASMADAVVSGLAFHQAGLRVYWRTDAHVCSVLWAAAVYLWLGGRRVSPLLPVGLFAAVFALAVTPVTFEFALVPILAAVCVCTLGQAPALVRAVLSWEPLTRLGIWSYSIYLWQQPLSRLTYIGVLPAWAALLLGLLCGITSFYLVEQPARRFLNARWRALPIHAPATAAAAEAAPARRSRA
jgi:peptidoglycan/LPS O-acetylase OafA/YrhL